MEYRGLLQRSWERRRGLSSRRAETPPGQEAGLLTAPVPGAADRKRPRVLRQRLFERFLRDIEWKGASDLLGPGEARARVRRLLDELADADAEALTAVERAQLEDEVVAEVCGAGPLEPLFADPTVSDVLVNGPDEVWVDRFGRLELTGVRFDGDDHLMRLLGRLVASQGRHLDEAVPYVDVRLPDGSRLHALIPPLAAHPVMSVRRARPVPFRLEELCSCGTVSPAMAAFLAAAVRNRLTLLVSGGTATGKTTLLGVLSSFIPRHERIITIEETAELRLDHPHVVSLEARLPNIEGLGEVTLRTLVKNSLRMRPDRIIVGEVRGPEVFDMLQAMNTGHDGSLTTVHANSPDDALRRLENLVLMGGFELPSRAIRELLGAAFDVIVQIARFPDGGRRVSSIREVVLEDERLTTVELFRFEEAAGGGRHVATGHRPRFLPRLAAGDPALAATFEKGV
ncbi:MAG TPA: CpaF family protein [Thermoanaerobaculia bacterium]